MTTLTKPTTVTLPLAIGRFALHFLEMCVVMCMGGGVLQFLVFSAIGAIGYPDIVARAPELGMLILAANFAIVMAVYMLLRGHARQHNIEMSGSTLLGAIPFILALWLGWIARGSLANWGDLFRLMCGPLCALMFVVMLVRFNDYGGRVGAVIATSASGEYTCPMHPDVRQAQAGKCPRCGMTLVRIRP